MARARIALAFVALATGMTVAFMITREGAESAVDALLGVGIGASFVASGLVAWARRPENSIGRLMVLAGFVRVGAEFCASAQPVLYPIGHLLHHGFWIIVAYVLLAFPSGRLDERASRWLFAGATLLLPLQTAWLLLGGDADTNAVALTESSVANVVDRVTTGLALVLVPLVIAVLVRRWRSASPRLRVAIAPVLWAGAVGFGLALVMLVDDALGSVLGGVPLALFDLGLAGVAVAFLVGLLRARLARTAVAELIVQLSRAGADVNLRDALAGALRDASLAVGYWVPDRERFVDVEGGPFELPRESTTRAVSFAERDGRRIAALVHDPALADEPELVRSVCAAAALALENERLQAELRARLKDLRESRVRIVEAAEVERRRLERNLHDGAQQRLVSIAMTLGLAETKVRSDPVAADAIFREARDGVMAALGELRELSHGIHPSILSERGLAVALHELSLRSAVPVELSVPADRLPERVEAAAYYVVCEALANVAKYAHATQAHVRVARERDRVLVEVADDGIGGADVTRGSGLRGLADRVEALGGRFTVSSPPGQGTVARAAIPCA